MNKIAIVFPFRLNSFTHKFVKCKNFTLVIILSIGLLESLQSQAFFSPNPKVAINQQKSDAFIKATPEIALKADYYNISKAVLETILILQSNSGTTTSDGRYNYGSVKVHPELTAYPAFSKSKNGFILCTTRSRGVEATALSLSLLRNDEKNALSDSQWLNLVFGPNGYLRSLALQADEIYTSRTGTSFVQLGIQLDSNMVASGMVKSNYKERNDANPKFESKTIIPKSDEIKVQKPEVPAQQVTEKKPTDQTPPPVAVKKEVIIQPSVPELENEKVLKPGQEVGDPTPAVTVGTKEEVIKQKEESQLVDKPEINSISANENLVNQAEKSTKADDLSPSQTKNEIESVSTESQDNNIPEPEKNIASKTNYTSPSSNTVIQHTTQKTYGPTDKGTQLLGGSASFVRVDGNSILTINPNMGSFVANNFAIGLNHFYAAKLDGDYRDINALGPYMKLYIGNSQKGKVFAQVSGAIAVADFDFDNITFSYGLRAGYAVFINNSIALEFSGGYDKVIDGDGRFGGNVGFQIHFNKNEKAKEDTKK